MSFQVPSGSRLTTKWFRDHGLPGLVSCASTPANGNNGWFLVRRRGGRRYFCVASDNRGWEHVSISLRTGGLDAVRRLPTWEEMCLVKGLFWSEDDTVIQYHPGKPNHRDDDPYTLHLWRPIGVTMPVPDPMLVGPMLVGPIREDGG